MRLNEDCKIPRETVNQGLLLCSARSAVSRPLGGSLLLEASREELLLLQKAYWESLHYIQVVGFKFSPNENTALQTVLGFGKKLPLGSKPRSVHSW